MPATTTEDYRVPAWDAARLCRQWTRLDGVTAVAPVKNGRNGSIEVNGQPVPSQRLVVSATPEAHRALQERPHVEPVLHRGP